MNTYERVVWEKAQPLPAGTIMHIGCRKEENGSISLDPRIARGINLYYDTNITDDPDEITNAEFPVEIVAIDGQFTLAISIW